MSNEKDPIMITSSTVYRVLTVIFIVKHVTFNNDIHSIRP